MGLMDSGDLRACPCEGRGTVEPCSGQCPSPPRSPGWNGPRLSFRRSLSFVPPSAMCCRHLHESSVNNVLSFRWVKSTPAIWLICIGGNSGSCCALRPWRPRSRPRCPATHQVGSSGDGGARQGQPELVLPLAFRYLSQFWLNPNPPKG